MHTKSPWVETTLSTKFPPLKHNIEVDVAIVGGGITGLTAGILLQRSGKNVAIIDNGLIAMGETGHTTAHLTQVLDHRYHQIISDFGVEQARLTAASKSAAIDQIEALIREYQISCDFQRVPGFLFSEPGPDTEDLVKEVEAMRSVKLSAKMVDEIPLPIKTKQAIRIEYQAQFHPRRYLLPLAEEIVFLGGRIYENTRVKDVSDGNPCTVETETGIISARFVIISANVPVTNWLFLNTKISAYRSYALGAQLRTPIATGLYWDTGNPYHYIRAHHEKVEGDILIVGGEDHKTGTKDDTETCFQNLERYARDRFDIGAILYSWSGQIINPLDGLPYIGLNSLSKHVYVSTGYSGNGITFGTLGGMILSDLILERQSPWATLYSATRFHPLASVGAFVSENKDFPAYFIGDRLTSRDPNGANTIHCHEGKVITMDGQIVAAYRDGDGTLHACSAVCPHMGCLVHWNQAESSWDCPCHGSRFDATGKVANGPALTDLKPVQIPEAEPAKAAPALA